MKITLENRSAVVAAVLILAAVLGYRVFLRSDLPENDRVRQQLEISLYSVISGDVTADTEAIAEAMASGDDARATELAEGLLERGVEIRDLAMRGGGEDIVIRAHFTMSGPDGALERVGYFSYSHSPVTGWRYRRRTTPLRWYTKLF